MSIQKIIEAVEEELSAEELKILKEERGMSTAELTVLIGDTLVGNKQFPQIDPEKIKGMRVDGDIGEIILDYDGVPIHIHVT